MRAGCRLPRFQRLALELLRHAPRSHGHRRLAVPVVHLLFQQLVLLSQLLNGFQLPAMFLVDILPLLCYIVPRRTCYSVSPARLGKQPV